MLEPGAMRLRLVGFAQLTESGYGLPLLERAHGGNTLYCPVASPPGDHLGVIIDFEPIDAPDIIYLAAHATRIVGLNDPWIDVFIHDGKVNVGTASDLWRHVAKRRLAPTMQLELAQAAEHPRRFALMQTARSYVERSFGTDVSWSWTRSVLRQTLHVSLHRHFVTQNDYAQAQLAIEGSEIEQNDTREFEVVLPTALSETLQASGALPSVFREVSRLAASSELRLTSKRFVVPSLDSPVENIDLRDAAVLRQVYTIVLAAIRRQLRVTRFADYEAEDVASDVLLQLLSRKESFSSMTELNSYAQSLARFALRSAATRHRSQLLPAMILDELRSPTENETDRLLLLARSALSDTPQLQRLLDMIVEGATTTQIAQALGITTRRVRLLRESLVRRLRDLLQVSPPERLSASNKED